MVDKDRDSSEGGGKSGGDTSTREAKPHLKKLKDH